MARFNLHNAHAKISIFTPSGIRHLFVCVNFGETLLQERMRLRAIVADNNPEDHGYLKGEITFVSQSTHEVKDVLSYRLKGRITDWALKPGIGRETLLRPGMDLRVEIITGTRSVMSYLFDPIEKTLREAMTEPN